jgi:hypothetical protein
MTARTTAMPWPCTFAQKFARRDTRAGKAGSRRGRMANDVDYPLFGG